MGIMPAIDRLMLGRVRAGHDAVLVPQSHVAVGIFSRRSIICSVSNAAVSRNRQHLLYVAFGFVPKFDFVGQVLAGCRRLVESRDFGMCRILGVVPGGEPQGPEMRRGRELSRQDGTCMHNQPFIEVAEVGRYSEQAKPTALRVCRKAP
jgi:hypothetical protein